MKTEAQGGGIFSSIHFVCMQMVPDRLRFLVKAVKLNITPEQTLYSKGRRRVHAAAVPTRIRVGAQLMKDSAVYVCSKNHCRVWMKPFLPEYDVDSKEKSF